MFAKIRIILFIQIFFEEKQSETEKKIVDNDNMTSL